MPKLKEVTRHVRSKNAGPFWVTVDIFFNGAAEFERYRDSAALSSERIAALYGSDPGQVKRFEVPSLEMIKISFPRNPPQGGIEERDMHSGQYFARMLDLELLSNDAR